MRLILALIRNVCSKSLHPSAKPFKMRQLIPMTSKVRKTAETSSFSLPAPRLRVGKMCVAIQAGSAAEMIERAETALQDARFLEFRLDALPEPAAAIDAIREFLTGRRDIVVIATCRRRPNGGNFDADLAAELDLLTQAAEAGCQMVDLEVESAEEAKSEQLEEFRNRLRESGTALLISFHDFNCTADLEKAANRIEAFRPEFVKVVSTAISLVDNLAVLQLIEERSLSAQMVGIAMGEEGIVSRVLGPRAGAAFTFAAANHGAETAPGQITARTLRDLYRVEDLDQATRIFGVAGNPIANSLSPLMQNTAFRRESVNAVLMPLKVHAVAELLTLLRELPLAGAAVTMPFKLEVLPFLANMDPLTQRIGACNTLRTGADGKLYGFNTDVAGVVRPLEKRLKLKGARIGVLGAGGAARAAVFGLQDKGAEVFIVNRTHETAVALAKEAKAHAIKHNQLAKHSFDALINSTPCGMRGAKETMPIAEDELNAALVFDMVYNPLETPFLKLAHSRGIPVISGLEMFVQQGARQFEIWTGKPAPETEMQRVVELELRRRG
jgi:3-dehydroquinate dehydratase/shikimate dehydrogenase